MGLLNTFTQLTFPYFFVKIQLDDDILWRHTSFSYIFAYYDVKTKNDDDIDNNEEEKIRCFLIVMLCYVI